MLRRILLAILFLPCLLVASAAASQPAGFAAKFITDLSYCNAGDLNLLPFVWNEFFGVRALDPADTVTVTLALIPFQTGQTEVTLSDGTNSTFLEVIFSDGMVDGLRYNRRGWNDVTLILNVATQSYTVTVNGAQAGPFPFAQFCADEGGCYSVESLVMFGFANGDGAVAWADSVSISRQSPLGQDYFDVNSFDACAGRPNVGLGGVALITTPPRRMVRTSDDIVPLRERP